jgi:hypothetical protein
MTGYLNSDAARPELVGEDALVPDGVDLSQPASLGRIDRLLTRWVSRGADGVALELRRDTLPAHGTALWGLTSHVYAQAQRIRPLIQEREGLELAPMVRSMFECALRAQWLVLRGPKALPGFLQVGARHRFNLGGTMLDAGWAGMTEGILQRLEEDIPTQGELARQAKNFEAMLEEFEQGRLFYAVYRFLSGLSHPGTTVIDAYMHLDEVAGKVTLHREPEVRGAETTWAWIIVWALVWSWSALDSIADKSPDRHVLKGIAREAGMPAPPLKLTAAAAAKAYADRYEAGRRPRGTRTRPSAR